MIFGAWRQTPCPDDRSRKSIAMPKIVFDDNTWTKVLWIALVLVAAGLIAWLLTFINSKIFKMVSRRQKGIHLAFFERLFKTIIVVGVFVIAISALDSGSSAWKTLLGGTAVISAVAAFAAQDVVKDIIAGLMISLQKPFEIGDRIELEDGTVGVVEDMTNRHVVLIGVDTLRVIVPNSKINAMMITNYCFKRECRSAKFVFPIGYDSDLELARSVILEAIMACPKTIPGREGPNGEPVYSEVYFMRFADSALMMQTTVYYENTTPTERLIDEVNTRVREALNANGVEIPYNYLNVVNVSEK